MTTAPLSRTLDGDATVCAYTDSAAFGGAERALATMLTGLSERGWRPTLLHSDAPGIVPLVSEMRARGIRTRAVADMPEGIGGARRALGLVRALRAERPDVFHAHLTWPFGCKWALAAAWAARVPAVLGTAHLFVDIPMGLSRRIQVSVLSRGVDRVIAVSEHTRTRYHVAIGWPLERLAVIPNAVPDERFARDVVPSDRTILADGTGRPVVLVPARLEEQKGHVHLLEAARLLPDVRFMCVGDGALREELGAAALRLGVADRVTFAGFRDDMPELLDACDLVVLPSLYEGLPLALIEAAAAGKVVVATDIGGTRELVIDGETGVLVPPRDPGALASAIARVLGDGALAARLGAAGRERAAREFSADAMVTAVEREYVRALGAEGQPLVGARQSGVGP